jgi:tetratricopeptide (TPR) repeat protein
VVSHCWRVVAVQGVEHADGVQRCRAALAILEEAGDRANIAIAYHQLGMIGESRGDYGTAEQYYQDSLAIKKEIGDRAGAAGTLSQLGVLRTGQGRPADAVSYQVQALAIRAELSSPDAATDIRMLDQQRAALGDQQFQRILRTLTDNDSAAAIMQLLSKSAEAAPPE